jgi:hypothetical protein
MIALDPTWRSFPNFCSDAASPGFSGALGPAGARNPADPVYFREGTTVQKIIEDETWLEGERRGCAVSPLDAVVRENVSRIIFRVRDPVLD